VTRSFFSGSAGGIRNVVWQITRLGFCAFPVSIGVAMLKCRLYEIDRLFSRTLAYAIVTGLEVVNRAVEPGDASVWIRQRDSH